MDIAGKAPEAITQEKINMEEVISEHKDLVYRVAFEYLRNKSDADDICQEVFLIYWNKKPMFESEQHRKAWLIRVTINKCNNLWKMPWNRKRVSVEEEEMEFISGKVSENGFAERMSDYVTIQQALGQLSGKERALVYLFYYEEYKVEDIAKLLSISQSAAYVRLNRVRKKLHKLLKGDYEYGQF